MGTACNCTQKEDEQEFTDLGQDPQTEGSTPGIRPEMQAIMRSDSKFVPLNLYEHLRGESKGKNVSDITNQIILNLFYF